MVYKKKGSVVSLVLGVLFFSSSSASTFAFTDEVPSYVESIAEHTKVFTELEQKYRFDGHKSVRRGEFLEWIFDNAQIDTGMYTSDAISTVFIDVSSKNDISEDMKSYISAGYALNVLEQFEQKGKFLKNKKLTRIEAVKMLFALEGIVPVPNAGSEMQEFWGDLPDDIKERNLILVAIEKGILRNKATLRKTNLHIKPYDYLTREDAIWMLYVLNNEKESTTNNTENITNSGNINNIEAVENILEAQFLKRNDIEKTALEDAAIEGMVNSLGDKYTVYMPPEQEEAFTKYINEEPETEKEYAGLGVAIQPATNGGLVITEIFSGSPAEISHMQVGDVIVGVDGETILELPVSAIVEKIKGEVGTSSVITVKRNGTELDIRFVRKKILVGALSTVRYEVKDSILWIRVRSFKSFTAQDFKDILDEHLSENSKIRGVIVDLRFNPGGLMNSAQEMLGEVLEEGSIAVRLYNADEKEDIYYVEGSGAYTDIPLVVFQNEYSASAAEIFSAAIKDYDRGDIIGTTSYGKGIAQQLFSLPRGALKVTTSEFRSPFQNIIHEIGVSPDHVMNDQSDESYFYEAKLRLK